MSWQKKMPNLNIVNFKMVDPDGDGAVDREGSRQPAPKAR
jgi:hypothetical protein